MFSQQLLDKWEKLLREKYKKDLNKQEVFDFANTLTNFFDSLIKFDKEEQSKQKHYEKNKKEN